MRSSTVALMTFLLFTGTSPASAAPTAAQRCEADIELAAAKYAYCRLTAEARFAKNLNAESRSAALVRCSERLERAFSRATARYGADCTTETVEAFDAHLAQCSDEVAAASTVGGMLPACGNGVIDGVAEQCDNLDLGGASCASLVSGSAGSLGCTTECQYDLTSCATASPGLGLPVSGQVTCQDVSTTATIPCDGTGFDGETQAGYPFAFAETGDGTLLDLNSGLMWEKKSDDGSIHDKDLGFPWTFALDPNGSFLGILNKACDEVGLTAATATLCDNDTDCVGVGNERCGFAGYRDWRMPQVKELLSIVNYEGSTPPKVPPAFDRNCTPDCNITTCSCTYSFVDSLAYYWSSTQVHRTIPNTSNPLWVINFNEGSVRNGYSSGSWFVRAVRGP